MDPAPPSTRSAPYRFFGLLRLVLASFVMVQHAGDLMPGSLAPWIGPLAVGSTAVFAFFILSGFVITEAVDAFYQDRPVAFLGNRLVRTVPTFVVAVLASALVFWLTYPAFVDPDTNAAVPPATFAPATVLLNLWSMFPGWKTIEARWHSPELLQQAWALRIEFVFYLAITLCTGLAAATRLKVPNCLTGAALILLLLVTLEGHRLDGSTLENVPYFVLGSAFYYVVARPGARRLPGVFCLVAVALIVRHLLGRTLVSTTGLLVDQAEQLAFLSVLTMGALALASIPAPRHGLARRAARWDRALGEITYPLYLLHTCVIIPARIWLPHGSWRSVAIAFAGAYLIAWIVVLAIERPAARLRALIRQRRQAVTPLAFPNKPLPIVP